MKSGLHLKFSFSFTIQSPLKISRNKNILVAVVVFHNDFKLEFLSNVLIKQFPSKDFVLNMSQKMEYNILISLLFHCQEEFKKCLVRWAYYINDRVKNGPPY